MTHYAENYNKLIQSIRSEKKMAFDMEWVFIATEGLPIEKRDGYNLCGTAGCILGHAAVALFPVQQAWRLVGGQDCELLPPRILKKLRLQSDAANALFYEDLDEKSDKAVVLRILRKLKPIAEKRSITISDVRQAQEAAYR